MGSWHSQNILSKSLKSISFSSQTTLTTSACPVFPEHISLYEAKKLASQTIQNFALDTSWNKVKKQEDEEEVFPKDLPEVEEVQDISIDKNDLRVDTFRASGAGGQHVNKTDSAVRLTHIPSGLVVECQDGRSQHKNKEKAMSLLAAKLKQQEIDDQQESIASERKILVGTGDRSEKIRTYNFPQGRMTDHRIKLTQHNLDQIMDGDIKSICDALLAENQLAMLSQLESE